MQFALSRGQGCFIISPMRVPFLLWTAPVAVAAGFGVAGWVRPEGEKGNGVASLIGEFEDTVMARPQKALVMLGEKGSRAVPEILADVEKMGPVDLRRRA